MGDLKIKVLSECGEPISKEIVGYTAIEYESTHRGRKTITKPREESKRLAITEWTYGPWSGYYYILTFKGSVLGSIDSARE